MLQAGRGGAGNDRCHRKQLQSTGGRKPEEHNEVETEGGEGWGGAAQSLALEPGGAEGREWKFPAGPSGKEAQGCSPGRSLVSPGLHGLLSPSRQKGLFTPGWQEEGVLTLADYNLFRQIRYPWEQRPDKGRCVRRGRAAGTRGKSSLQHRATWEGGPQSWEVRGTPCLCPLLTYTRNRQPRAMCRVSPMQRLLGIWVQAEILSQNTVALSSAHRWA